MMTPIEEKKDEKIRMGMVQVSDGKSRPRLARLVVTMDAVTVQREAPAPQPQPDRSVPHARERMVQITRQKVGGLGLSIKGGAEHKLPILISKIYKDQAADQTGQLFVGDAVIKVNGEYITACNHDDAVNILRNAGDIVVLTVKHYRAATPFLQKQADAASDTDSSTGDEHPSLHSKTLDDNCNSERTNDADGGWQSAWSAEEGSRPASRPPSAASAHGQDQTHWVDVVSVPLMMAYVTRYVFGTDKLRPGAFEVRARPHMTTGVIHAEDPAALSQWLKSISDNIVGLTNLQMKLFNRHLSGGERIEYMGWVHEGLVSAAQPWQTYRPKFLVLKGTDVMLFDVPPMNIAELAKCPETLKVYQTMFRTVKESETVDWRQHCFLVQASGAGPGASPAGPRYFSADTRRDLLRVEAAWTHNIVNSVVRLGKKTFTVVHMGRAAGLTLDWASGFSLSEGTPGAPPVWSYRFSQLRGSSDDGKSKLKLHFQDTETKVIETKELECQILQSLLFCMHAFLTAKVASVDPAFLASIQQSN
ncbi:gamma-2-syntrophin isoform X1 [Battus philenor]|uniref:gamma-2-syntrophin isoform X1 n=1 Tax=Battus philenor TaxID=42288 RepID=UPI0035D11960